VFVQLLTRCPRRSLATVGMIAEKHVREKLIDVALDLCIGQGYEATTIDQIATAGGVTSPAVGRYFATKDAIILSIVDDIVVAVATELAKIPPQTSPPEALFAANTAVRERAVIRWVPSGVSGCGRP
jgi:AcrR family transcriptional regulator